MDTNVNNDLEEPFNTTAAVWLIDPVRQSITEIDTPHLESLVSATVGDDADCFRLDTKYNVAWMSDTDSNPRYAYYFEGMDCHVQCQALFQICSGSAWIKAGTAIR